MSAATAKPFRIVSPWVFMRGFPFACLTVRVMRSRILGPLLVALACFPTAFAAGEVIVRPGDSWYAIASRHNLTPDVLQSLNPGKRNLHPGDTLKLPDGARYVVQRGDSLHRIADEHRVSLGALMAANGLREALVNPGTMLRIPSEDDVTPSTWVIKEGDTLYDIALAAGVTVEHLVMMNNLEGSVIHPGDTLVIHGAAPAQQREPLRVSVERGDSLWGIANEHGVTVRDLAAANGLSTNATLRVGQALTIPGRFEPSSTQIGGVATRTITVQAGDTLYSLAREHGTTVGALLSANNLSHPDIYVGQRLRVIPSADMTPAAAVFRPGGVTNLAWPARGIITSRFGYRTLPNGSTDVHNGIDIDAKTGDPVYAAAAGVVTKAEWHGGLGYAVFIQSGSIEYRYGHNSELLVREGEHVQAGQVIAKAGNTGFSFGSHVHFEVRVDGTPVDPLPLLDN